MAYNHDPLCLRGVTAREKQIIEYRAAGFVNKEIAAMLGISDRTVEIHVQNGLRKLRYARVQDLVRDTLEYSEAIAKVLTAWYHKQMTHNYKRRQYAKATRATRRAAKESVRPS